jgi:hypothetical protein
VNSHRTLHRESGLVTDLPLTAGVVVLGVVDEATLPEEALQP